MSTPLLTRFRQSSMANSWATLMARLGYTHYVAQGGDWSAFISNAMAEQAPPGLLGIHVNYPGTLPTDIGKALKAGAPPPAAQERRNPPGATHHAAPGSTKTPVYRH